MKHLRKCLTQSLQYQLIFQEAGQCRDNRVEKSWGEAESGKEEYVKVEKTRACLWTWREGEIQERSTETGRSCGKDEHIWRNWTSKKIKNTSPDTNEEVESR